MVVELAPRRKRSRLQVEWERGIRANVVGRARRVIRGGDEAALKLIKDKSMHYQ